MNSGAIATRKRVAIQCLQTVVLSLTFAGTACDAFHAVPIRRANNSRQAIPTTTTVDIHPNSFNGSILVGSNSIVLKATSIDQEQDKNNIGFGTYTDRIKLPTNDIDRVEIWCLDWLEECYVYSERHTKCPFFRRRYGDILDNVESFVRFFMIRPYCKDSSSRLGPSMSCKSLAGEGQKTKHLPIGELLDVLRKDWNARKDRGGDPERGGANTKGYYVTGRMSTRIYRGDCEFRSPDPDLPLTGLRKYVGVASHLFDSKASHSKLISLEELCKNDQLNEGEGKGVVLKAEWTMSLTINLPWKPRLSEFSGSTLYFLDKDHLICRHQEAWDISVLDAFLGMMSIPKKDKSTIRCPLALFSLHNRKQHNLPSIPPSHASGNDNKDKEGPSVECT